MKKIQFSECTKHYESMNYFFVKEKEKDKLNPYLLYLYHELLPIV